MNTKINIVCMDENGHIACGMMTSNEKTANDYIRRKNALGLITIKQVK
ncbi:MAG: hypothetical protein II630_02285 [Bacteroidales bacterium]|nr:hypothetical protein [Bacteroidales bacterium]